MFRSSKQIYVQVIDDAQGKTLAAASSIDKAIRADLKTGADVAAATAVGKLVAERAKAAGVTKVIFDRSGYIYHGRVKALADAPARAAWSSEGAPRLTSPRTNVRGLARRGRTFHHGWNTKNEIRRRGAVRLLLEHHLQASGPAARASAIDGYQNGT